MVAGISAAKRVDAVVIDSVVDARPQESICAKIWRVVKELWAMLKKYGERVWYFFELRQLRNSPSPFQAKIIPATIPNQGNTCFAAAWMQVVASNRILSGAYRTLFKSNWIWTRLFGQHYALNFLDQYQKRQLDGRSPVEIRNLRLAFGQVDDLQQEDATELSHKLQGQLVMPTDGEVRLEDGSTVTFGCRLQSCRNSDQKWVPYDPDRSGAQTYSPPIFSLNFGEKNAPTLSDLIYENLWHDKTFIKSLQACKNAFTRSKIRPRHDC